MADFDTEYTDFITCPYCGEVHQDSWEIELALDAEEGEWECQYCGKTFLVEIDHSVSYTTRKEEGK